MLGIRLSDEAEARLERHARALGRGKSVVAREWILERLERESVDDEMRRASELVAADASTDRPWNDVADAWLSALDAEDGGYDWGPEGPPT